MLRRIVKERIEMADISTSYMGIKLKSPVIVGAGPVSKRIESIKKAEDAGAGAIVLHSLFQEQIENEIEELEAALMIGSYLFSEALTYFPILEHSGAREHVMWVEKTRKAVKMPMIGSLNANELGNWLEYAKVLQNAGCDALELNVYSVETDPTKNAEEVEKRTLDIVQEVVGEISIPVSVKLSPYYTAIAEFVTRISKSGIKGIVLFNRFYQPSIDIETETLKVDIDLSRPEENRLPLRWTAILSGLVDTDIVTSTGVHSGGDVIKQLLAGAKAAQSVSAIVKYGEGYITRMNDEISDWMDKRGYGSIEDFRGKLNQRNVANPFEFERIQYVNMLMGRKL